MVKNFTFKLRRDTAENWIAANPVLLEGEPGVELLEEGSSRVKIGDGVRAWDDLPYFLNELEMQVIINEAVASTLSNDVPTQINAAIAAESQARSNSIDAAITAESQARSNAIAAESQARSNAIAAEAQNRVEAIALEAQSRQSDISSLETNLTTLVDTKIIELVDGAPETLDTLRELAESVEELNIIHSHNYDGGRADSVYTGLLGVDGGTSEGG